MHFSLSEDQEINTAWQPGIAPWDFQMTQAGYNAHALADFSSGQIVRYTHPGSGENIRFQPQQLQYTNDLNQIQAIANPQAVQAQVMAEDTLLWTGAYGPGFDLRWQAQTARLDKRLVVDSAARFPAPSQFIIDGGNPVLRFQFIFALSSGVDVYVNDVLWTRGPGRSVETQGYVEFRLSSTGEILWQFNLPRTFKNEEEDSQLLGTFRLRRQANNLFVEHRIPLMELRAAIYPVEIDTTIDEQVSAGSDDAWQATSDGVAIADLSDSVDHVAEHLGWRWSAVDVPAGTTIDLAQMGVVILAPTQDEPKHQIRGQAADSPGTFTTGNNDIDSRTRTSATVEWNSTDLGAAAGEFWEWGASVAGAGNGVDLSAIVQEIVDRAGWATGQAMIMIAEQHTSTDAARDLGVDQYDKNTASAAKLHIEYTETAGGPPAVVMAPPIPA